MLGEAGDGKLAEESWMLALDEARRDEFLQVQSQENLSGLQIVILDRGMPMQIAYAYLYINSHSQSLIKANR